MAKEKLTTSNEKLYNLREYIFSILPHGFPILLIDRVLEITDDSIIALKNISLSDPIIQGHFTDRPIYPGVFVLEAMSQAAAILAHRLLNHDINDRKINNLFFMGCDKIRWRDVVIPGDQLILNVKKERLKFGIKRTVFRAGAVAMVDDKIVAEATLLGGTQ